MSAIVETARRKKCVNPSAFRRSAQPLGTLRVDPKSNRYIPRNARSCELRIMVRGGGEPDYSSLLTLYISFISPTKTPLPTSDSTSTQNIPTYYLSATTTTTIHV